MKPRFGKKIQRHRFKSKIGVKHALVTSEHASSWREKIRFCCHECSLEKIAQSAPRVGKRSPVMRGQSCVRDKKQNQNNPMLTGRCSLDSGKRSSFVTREEKIVEREKARVLHASSCVDCPACVWTRQMNRCRRHVITGHEGVSSVRSLLHQAIVIIVADHPENEIMCKKMKLCAQMFLIEDHQKRWSVCFCAQVVSFEMDLKAKVKDPQIFFKSKIGVMLDTCAWRQSTLQSCVLQSCVVSHASELKNQMCLVCKHLCGSKFF